MKLSELIAAYGDEKVRFQKLDDDADEMRMGKHHTKITFGTRERLGLNGTNRMGLVVWMDRDRVAEILAPLDRANRKE